MKNIKINKKIIFTVVVVIVLLCFVGLLFIKFNPNIKEEQGFGTEEFQEVMDDGTIIKVIKSKNRGDNNEIVESICTMTTHSDNVKVVETTNSIDYDDDSRMEEYILENYSEDGSVEIQLSSKHEFKNGRVEQKEEKTYKDKTGNLETLTFIYTQDKNDNTIITETKTIVDSKGNEEKYEKVTIKDLEGNVISEEITK